MKAIRTVLFIISGFLLLPLTINAQERTIEVRNFDVNLSDIRAKVNAVPDGNGKPCALIEITLSSKDTLYLGGNKSIVGTPEHTPGKYVFYMPEGTGSIELAVAGCSPCVFEFPSEKRLESGRSYIMELYIKELNPLRMLVMPTYSYNESQSSYGLMLGLGRRYVGGYVHAKTDFTFGLDPKLTCDSNGNIGSVKGWFTDKEATSRWSVTGGYLGQLFDNEKNASLYAYAGGGYGSRILAWETYRTGDTYDYARVSDYSFTGFEAELGLIFRFGPVAVSAGVQTNQFKYWEANVGIGIMFGLLRL